MAMDFDAMRVNDLFKDSEKNELRAGITIRDINSISGLTPLGRNDLQELIQKAYRIAYNSYQDEIQRITPPPTSAEKSESEGFTYPRQTLAEQMANAKANATVGFNPMPDYEGQLREKNGIIESLKKEISEANSKIEALEQEKNELVEELYKLEKHHLGRYKELNEKYESLKDNSPLPTNNNEDSGRYLRIKLSESEQREAALAQENANFKRMLGL